MVLRIRLKKVQYLRANPRALEPGDSCRSCRAWPQPVGDPDESGPAFVLRSMAVSTNWGSLEIL